MTRVTEDDLGCRIEVDVTPQHGTVEVTARAGACLTPHQAIRHALHMLAAARDAMAAHELIWADRCRGCESVIDDPTEATEDGSALWCTTCVGVAR